MADGFWSVVEMALALVHLAALELHRDVLDSKQTHGVVYVLEDVLMSIRLTHDRVRAHRHEPRGDRPDMQVVHGLDAGYGLELRTHGAQRDVGRRRLEQHVHRFPN